MVCSAPLPTHNYYSAGECRKSGPDETDANSSTEDRLSFVIIEDYRKCRGFTSLWVALSQATLCSLESPSLPRPAPGEWLPAFSEKCASISDEPATPPPKAAV